MDLTFVLARLRYLVARNAKLLGPLIVSAAAAAVEAAGQTFGVDTQTYYLVVIAIDLVVLWLLPNAPRPNELDHAIVQAKAAVGGPIHEELIALEGVDVDAVAPYVEPAELPDWKPDSVG